MEFNRIKIEPLSANIGAEVQGVDLTKLDDRPSIKSTRHSSVTKCSSFETRSSRANGIFLSVAASGNSIFIRPLPHPKAIPQ